MIIWLASYPRSGSHLLRMILQRCFDLGSYEIYQGQGEPVNAEEAALLGLRQFPDASAEDFLARARKSPDLFLVKTHDPIPDGDTCIYVVRDGRAAIASYERYLADVGGLPLTVPDIIAGRAPYGTWHDHVAAFAARDEARTLMLRYEDLASDRPPLERIADFIGKPARNRFDISFSRLNQLDARRYGTGHNRPGIASIESAYGDLFWRDSEAAMRRLGYDRQPNDREGVKQKTFFLHLPKTAGTSVWSVLRDIAGPERTFQASSRQKMEEFSALSFDERAAFTAVGGHSSLAFYRERLNLSDYFCITTFREPVRRLRSEYTYAAQNPNHSNHTAISQMTFSEFVGHRANPITRFLGHQGDARRAFDTVRDVFDRWVLTSEIDVLIAELYWRAGRSAPATPYMNVGPQSASLPPLDEGELAAIKEHHEADIELYHLLVESQRGRPVSAKPSAAVAAPVPETIFHVVTPTFNMAPFLDETIHSVVTQVGNFSIRYHIQDGGSTDATLAIARRWQERIRDGEIAVRCKDVTLTVDSRRDRGMYDALAIGFERLAPSPNDIMTWINGDDRLAPGAMASVSDALRDLPNVQLVGGRRAILDAVGQTIGPMSLTGFPRRTVAAGLHDGRHLAPIMQEGSFWRASLWQKAGGIDTSFRLAGDWDLWRRFAAEADYVSLDTVTGYHRRRPGQLSGDMDAYWAEIDTRLSDPQMAATYNATMEAYLAEQEQRDPALPFPSPVARRDVTGHWIVDEGEAPLPLRRRLLQVDGDWIVVSGFGDLEGPFPEMGVPTTFHWSLKTTATMEFYSARAGRRRLSIGVRGMMPGQKITAVIEGAGRTSRRLRGRVQRPESLIIEHDFGVGPHRLEVGVDRLLTTPEGRSLGVMVTEVELVRSTRQGRWGFGLFGHRAAPATGKQSGEPAP